MGVLEVQLKEAKNLEAKDFGGTSDPFCKLSIISSQEEEDTEVVKSRVIKKSLSPQWNETLNLNLANPVGRTLKIFIKDWNRIGKSVYLGETSIPLDDLKPNVPKHFNLLGLQNGKGFITFSITFKTAASLTVYVIHGEQPRMKYDLLRSVKLGTQLDLLCQLLGIEEKWEDHSLWLNDKMLTDAHLKDPNFEIPSFCDLRLMVKPNLQVNSVLEVLKSGAAEAKKKATFDLKKQLEDAGFAQAFIQANGIAAITSVILSSSGNTLAYGLVALDSALAHGFGWDISPALVSKIVKLLQEEANVNVFRAACKIAVHLAGSKNHGFPALNEAMRTESGPTVFYNKMVAQILSSDEGIQELVLEFVTSMLNSAKDRERDDIINILEGDILTMKLKGVIIKANESVKKLIIKYLKIKHNLHVDPVPYSKDNPEHEKLLMELWNTVFPETKLESRVSEQWKWFGFQGTDPATDFRGMGIVGLKHLLYFCKTYTSQAKTIMITQMENSSQAAYYPVAVAGITTSNVLLEIFANFETQPKLLDLLLDHGFALEELYCICLKYFDAVWDDEDATYMEFSKIISEVKGVIKENLSTASNIEQFNQKCQIKEKGKKKKKKDDKKDKPKQPGVALVQKRPSAKLVTKSEGGAIHEAVKTGNTKGLLDMLKDGVSVDEKDSGGNTPLHISVLSNNLEMVQLLLWKDANVAAKNNDGWTALHEAAKNSNLEIIMALLKRGADPNFETADGVTAMHYLMSRPFDDSQLPLVEEVLNEMVLAGVNIDSNKNSNLETPLHYATSGRLLKNIQLLIDHGADINAKNKRGYTCLHIAALQDQLEIVKLLLKAGADIKIASRDGSFEDMMKKMPKIKETYDQIFNTPHSLPVPVPRVAKRIPSENSPRASVALNHASLIEGFHPTLNRRTAQEKIKNFNQSGYYIVCPSDIHNCFALTTYIDQKIKQFQIIPRPTGGYLIQDSGDFTTYPSLPELIHNSSVTSSLKAVPKDVTATEAIKQAIAEVQQLSAELAQADPQKPEWGQTSRKLKSSLNKLSSLL